MVVYDAGAAAPAPGPSPTVRRYRAWLPTISGRLSFSIFGDTSNPTQAHSTNIADDGIRFLVAYQYRDASDVPLPFRSLWAHRVLGIDGRVWFVFVAHTESEGNDQQYRLVGRAFIIKDKSDWDKHVLPQIGDYQDFLQRFEYPGAGDLCALAQPRHDDLLNFCTHHCHFYADVTVKRSGTSDFSFPFPVDRTGPNIPLDPRRRDQMLELLASQLYFFVKDLGHIHQHHNRKTDQILRVYRYDGTDDLSWRHHTLYSIYREVIRIKRYPHVTTFPNSLGLIAYAQAFTEISKDEIGGPREEAAKKLPLYFANYIIDSIRSSQAREERRFARLQRRMDLLRNTIISVSALFFSLLGLLKLANYPATITPNWMLTDLLKWILLRPLPAVGILSLITGTITLLLDIGRSEISRFTTWVMRLSQSLPRWGTILWLSINALGWSGVFAYLLTR